MCAHSVEISIFGDILKPNPSGTACKLCDCAHYQGNLIPSGTRRNAAWLIVSNSDHDKLGRGAHGYRFAKSIFFRPSAILFRFWFQCFSLPMPRKATLQHHQMLPLPRKEWPKSLFEVNASYQPNLTYKVTIHRFIQVLHSMGLLRPKTEIIPGNPVCKIYVIFI